jgi:hypothetical protein
VIPSSLGSRVIDRGFVFDVGCGTGLGTSMTKRSGKGERLARPNAAKEYWPSPTFVGEQDAVRPEPLRAQDRR